MILMDDQSRKWTKVVINTSAQSATTINIDSSQTCVSFLAGGSQIYCQIKIKKMG